MKEGLVKAVGILNDDKRTPCAISIESGQNQLHQQL
jgi:hypothetical protein